MAESNYSSIILITEKNLKCHQNGCYFQLGPGQDFRVSGLPNTEMAENMYANLYRDEPEDDELGYLEENFVVFKNWWKTTGYQILGTRKPRIIIVTSYINSVIVKETWDSIIPDDFMPHVERSLMLSNKVDEKRDPVPEDEVKSDTA